MFIKSALAAPRPPLPIPGPESCSFSSPPKLKEFECIFGNLVGMLIPLAGIIFFIMLLMGGFKYMTASGNPQQIDSAHKTITYAIGGLLVTALAYTILVVINYVTGADITNFVIYVP